MENVTSFPHNNSGVQIQPEILSVFTCYYLDFPWSENRTECSASNSSNCVKCPIMSGYFTGESMEQYGGLGHIVCLILLIVGSLIAICGICANILVITILVRMKFQKEFHNLLMALTICELFCCVTVVTAAIAKVQYLENINRSEAVMYALFIGIMSALHARSTSAFLTVLITVERYLVIKFPSNAHSWFTKSKIWIQVACIVAFSSLLAFPRYTSVYVAKNEQWKDVPGMSQFEYIFSSSHQPGFWWLTVQAVDYWLPFPLLLLFNALIFYEVKKWQRRRAELSSKTQKDIKATKMLAVIVVVLFFCNISAIVHYFFTLTGLIHREVLCGVLFSLCVNSSANLAIYYYNDPSFNKELKLLFSKVCTSGSSERNGKDGEAPSSSNRDVTDSGIVSEGTATK